MTYRKVNQKSAATMIYLSQFCYVSIQRYRQGKDDGGEKNYEVTVSKHVIWSD